MSTATARSFFRSAPVGSSLDEVSEEVDLHTEIAQPIEGAGDRRLFPDQLADEPAHVLPHVGPPDVRHDVELTRQPGDDRLLDQILGERELDPVHEPAAFRLRFPERKPSRSMVTYSYPAWRTTRTMSSRRATASPRSVASSSMRARSP